MLRCQHIIMSATVTPVIVTGVNTNEAALARLTSSSISFAEIKMPCLNTNV